VLEESTDDQMNAIVISLMIIIEVFQGCLSKVWALVFWKLRC